MRRRKSPYFQKRLVFNCTPQVPYSPAALLAYINALGGVKPGTLNEMRVRHDAAPGEACRNCGVKP